MNSIYSEMYKKWISRAPGYKNFEGVLAEGNDESSVKRD